VTEAQFNAIRRAEAAAAQLAEKFGLRRPTFWLPHTDDDIAHFHTLAAIADFLEKVMAKASVQEVVQEVVPESVQESPEPIFVPDWATVVIEQPSLSDVLRAATLDELEEIPGIGKVTARRIKEGLG